MPHREVGGPDHELFPVLDGDGPPYVECPRQHRRVLFSECQCCEHGTVLRLKGERLPFVVCPSGGEPQALHPQANEGSVRSIMARAIAVRPELSLEGLIRLFIDEHLTASPVVNEVGELVGIVSKTDVVVERLGWNELRDAVLSARGAAAAWQDDLADGRDVFISELLRERTVADVMSRRVIQVSAEAPIAAAAEVLTRTGLHHLPATDESGRPVGMLNSTDLSQWVAYRRTSSEP
jgi:CBS domain-containing protein